MQNLTPVINYLNDPEVLSLVFGGQKDIYLETTVKEFLFDGYDICEQTKINETIKTNPSLFLKASITCLAIAAVPSKNIKPTKDKLVFTFLNHVS